MSQSQSPSHHVPQQPQMPPQYYYPQPPQDDEFDLSELFAALWKGKWIIIACTFICTALAIAYALMAKEQWSSTAKVTNPQISDYSEYRNQLMQFEPILGDHLELQKLVDSQYLFSIYCDEFNSLTNKREFLKRSLLFKKGLDAIDQNNEQAVLRLYNDWYKLLSMKPSDIKSPNGPQIITMSAGTSKDSFELLDKYMHFIDKKVYLEVMKNALTVINVHKTQLMQSSVLLTQQAKQELLLEKKRTEHALHIAKAAGVNKPLQNFGEHEMFAINLGSDALAAKAEVLTKIKDLAVIEPELDRINNKLEQIKLLAIDNNIKFSAYRYLDQPERKVSRDKPKRALIAILGFLLGGFIGLSLVIIYTRNMKDK